MCEEFSECYNDVNVCLWTNGSLMSQFDAYTACLGRNSFLPRITSSNMSQQLSQFRASAWNLLGDSGFWIDVTSLNATSFHWIDGSPLAGLFLTLSVL